MATGDHMNLTDDERESLISTAAQLSMQGSNAVRRFWWDQMKALIAARSAEQIERMEIAKGLRAA